MPVIYTTARNYHDHSRRDYFVYDFLSIAMTPPADLVAVITSLKEDDIPHSIGDDVVWLRLVLDDAGAKVLQRDLFVQRRHTEDRVLFTA